MLLNGYAAIFIHVCFFFSVDELVRPEDGNTSEKKDARSDDLGAIAETTTTIRKDENVATEDSTRGRGLNANAVNLVKDEKSVLDILDEPLTESVSQRESQVEQVHRGQRITDVSRDPATGTVSIQNGQVEQVEMEQLMTDVVVSTTNVPKAEDDQSVTVDVTSTLIPDDSVAEEVETKANDQVQQVEKEASTKDVAECITKISKEEGDYQRAVVADIASNLVFGDNVVDTRENEAHSPDFDESTVNVSEAGDSQSLVIPDVHMTFVPDDNVGDGLQKEQSGKEVLGESATEFNISNLVDRIEGEASTIDELVKNVDGDTKKDDTFNDAQAVFGAEKDDQPATINISTTLVPGDKVVDQLPSGSTYSEYLITDDVQSLWARAFYNWTLSAGSPSKCEEPRSGCVDIDSVKPTEQVSHVTSTRVANDSGKKGFAQHEDKVEGKGNKISGNLKERKTRNDRC